MSSDFNILLEMGFSENRAKRALAATQYKGLQVAMDWIIAHEDDPTIDDPYQEPEGHKLGDKELTADAGDGSSEQSGSGGNQTTDDSNAQGEAKSLKCDDCGKLIKTPTDVEVHAARTGHQNYSESQEEIKPLTEEEKKAQMEKLQEKMKQKQIEKQKHEKQEALDKEKLRRKQGKEMTSMRQQQQMDDIKQLAEFKKREKMEDKLARQKVKEQIAQDRAERAAKFGTSSPGDSNKPAGKSSPIAAPPAKKEYNQARIQIRLTDGSALTHTFSADELLAAVRLYVEMNRTDGAAPFTFMTTFPRKVFSTEDMETPLKELGLVPSAVLVTKPL